MRYWHELSPAEQDNERRWNGFRRFWEELALAASGRLHLVAFESYDEGENWCDSYEYVSSKTRIPSEATCLKCLLNASSYGASAADRLAALEMPS